jgi:DNA-binding beta-propeller fold protein YncE
MGCSETATTARSCGKSRPLQTAFGGDLRTGAALRALAFIAVACCFNHAALAEEATGYLIAAVSPIPDGGSGWDHVSIDTANRHVFVGRGPAGLAVLDADTGAYILSVPETKGSHGAAIAPDLGLGFSDNGKGGDLTIFDLKTLKPTAHLQVGETTDGVFYDPVTRTGLVNNGETGHVTFFDPLQPRVLASLDLETKKPEFAVVDGRGAAFIDLQDRNAVARIDMRARKVTATWPLVGCDAPSSIAYDAGFDRLFVGCRGAAPAMAVVDASSGRTVATLPIGQGNDWAAFEPDKSLVFLANGGSATLTVIRQMDADHYREEETVGTRPLARTGAIDVKTDTIFLVAAHYSRGGPGPDGKPVPIRIQPGTTEAILLRRNALAP